MQKIIYISLASLLLAAGCASSRRVERNTHKNETEASISVEEIMRNNLTRSGFSINRADINYNIDGVSGRLVAAIRHKYPDTMMIIMKHTTGVEFVRIYLDPDTLLINDRINKRIMYGDPEYMERRYGIERAIVILALGDILLLSNAEIGRINSQKCQKGTVKGQSQINGKVITYEIDCSEKKIVSATINGIRTNEKIRLWYSNFFENGDYNIPGKVEVEDMSNKARISIVIKTIEIPWEGQLRFIPGNRYKKVMIR